MNDHLDKSPSLNYINWSQQKAVTLIVNLEIEIRKIFIINITMEEVSYEEVFLLLNWCKNNFLLLSAGPFLFENFAVVVARRNLIVVL